MEQQKSPVDVAASIPDKENPYADFITLLFDPSILAPLSLISDQLPDEVVTVCDFAVMRNVSGSFLSIYLETPNSLKFIDIPFNSALVLLSCICGAARSGDSPRAYPVAVSDQ